MRPKLAKINTELQPHQKRVVERIKDPNQPGLVVAHGLGSGKTLTSIRAQDALQMKAEAVVPASLQDNYRKEIKKHTSGKSSIKVESLQNKVNKGTPPDAPLLIVDEAHRARDPSSKTYQMLSKNTAQKRLLLTGSPFYNHPSDIAPLVNLAANDRILPNDKEEFEKQYIKHRVIRPGVIARLRGVRPGTEPGLNPRRAKELRETLNKWVDYYEGSKKDFPDVTKEDVKVPMGKKQIDVYDSLMGKAPFWVRAKVKAGLPPTKSESKQLNAFLTAARQASNSTAPYITKGTPEDPKIERAYQELKKELDSNPRSKAVVYSNYLDAGVNPYKQRLDKAGIPYGEFTGAMSKKKRDELVRKYNSNELRALLLSSAGGEGLDLKGTRLMQVLEPHWNDEKLRQVEGRGIRYKSHEGLPKEEQNVRIQRFLATRPRKGLMEKLRLSKPGFGVDEYLTRMSESKERLNNEFRELLKTEG
jgi:superfamily II DNA or RNA helicase